MPISRARLVLLTAICVAAVSLRAASSSAQTPLPVATEVPDTRPSLQLSQKSVTAATGGPAQEVDATISTAYPVQVRLFENGSTLIFDGFTSDSPGTIAIAHTRDCGLRYSYDLFVIVNGGVAARRSASIVLCPEAIATPSPAPATPIATGSPAAAAAARAAAPAPPEAAAAPFRETRRPGEPPVPAPPLEPPSVALASGFALAQPDDMAAASATVSGTPYLRVLAIWLRGIDANGDGGSDYQYVQIANLGGAVQDLTGWALQGDSGTISGLVFYFPDGFSLDPGASCRIYVGHPAENTCTDGSFALYHFWGDHGTATLWDDQSTRVDSLPY